MYEAVYVAHPDKARKFNALYGARVISRERVGPLGYKRYTIQSGAKPYFISKIEATPIDFSLALPEGYSSLDDYLPRDQQTLLVESLKMIVYRRLGFIFDNHQVVIYRDPVTIHIYPEYEGELVYVSPKERKLLRINLLSFLDLIPISSHPLIWKNLLYRPNSKLNLDDPSIQTRVMAFFLSKLSAKRVEYEEKAEDFNLELLSSGVESIPYLVEYDGIAFYHRLARQQLDPQEIEYRLARIRIGTANDILEGVKGIKEELTSYLSEIAELKGYKRTNASEYYYCPDGSDLTSDLTNYLQGKDFTYRLTGSWVDDSTPLELEEGVLERGVKVAPDKTLLIPFRSLTNLRQTLVAIGDSLPF